MSRALNKTDPLIFQIWVLIDFYFVLELKARSVNWAFGTLNLKMEKLIFEQFIRWDLMRRRKPELILKFKYKVNAGRHQLNLNKSLIIFQLCLT